MRWLVFRLRLDVEADKEISEVDGVRIDNAGVLLSGGMLGFGSIVGSLCLAGTEHRA